MRISDWSSDVCSSDLGVERLLVAADLGDQQADVHADARHRLHPDEFRADRGARLPDGASAARGAADPDRLSVLPEIYPPGGLRRGRALRRDRKSTRLNPRHACATRMTASAWKNKNTTK